MDYRDAAAGGPPISGGPPAAALPPDPLTESPPVGSADLSELLRQAARGDECAFTSVYDATSARAFGLAVQVLRDRTQAEEVTQEAYLEVWRNASRFDPERGSAASWIMTIVHRRAVDRVRSSEAATRRDTQYEEKNQTVSHDVTAETAHASLEAHRVRRALSSLTPVQREAVELAYLKGYTHTEVASLLDLPVGTAKTRIRDGLIRLRDTLGVGGGQ